MTEFTLKVDEILKEWDENYLSLLNDSDEYRYIDIGVVNPKYFSYIPTYKICISTNEMPYMSSQGFDMKRRIKIIPFNQRFYEPESGLSPVKDKDLPKKLEAEA